MARRRDSKGTGILIAIGLVVAAVAFLGPFAIALWVLVGEARALRYGGASKPADIISTSEREAIASGEAALGVLQSNAAAVHARGDRLGLLRRMEGSRFDARNRQGRDLNDQLDMIDGQLADLGYRFGVYQGRLSSRLEGWLSARSGQTAARAALLTYLAVFVVILLSQLDTSGAGASVSRIMFGTASDGAIRTMASFAATLAGLGVGWLAGTVRRQSLAA
jgi:hypothetical protein